MSGDRYENPEKLYFGRTLRPHCPTCVCPETNLFNRKTRRVCYPSPPRKERQRVVRRQYVEDVADEVSDDDEQPMIRSGQHRMEVRMERRHPPSTTQEKRKLGILEKWFERFDFNGDDLLDQYELRSFFKYLGVLLSKEYCHCLLDRADRDGDGRLSFSEFLLLWKIAQQDEELADIITELYYPSPRNEHDYLKRRNPEVRGKGEERGPQVQLPPQRRCSAGQEPRVREVGEEEGSEVLQSGDDASFESSSSLRSCYNEVVKEIEYVTLFERK